MIRHLTASEIMNPNIIPTGTAARHMKSAGDEVTESSNRVFSCESVHERNVDVHDQKICAK